MTIGRSELIARLLEDEGYSMAEVARRLGISRERVRQIARAAGIGRRRNAVTGKRSGEGKQRAIQTLPPIDPERAAAITAEKRKAWGFA